MATVRISMDRTENDSEKSFKTFSKNRLTKPTFHCIISFVRETRTICASGSVVEYRLAKARVAGSNPVSRFQKRHVIPNWYRVSFFRVRSRTRRFEVYAPLRSVQTRRPPDVVHPVSRLWFPVGAKERPPDIAGRPFLYSLYLTSPDPTHPSLSSTVPMTRRWAF